jgi:HSP20 family protein
MSSLQRRGIPQMWSLGGLDRLFDEWMRSAPMRRPFSMSWDMPGEELIRVDEYRDGDTLVIRAEIPGIDPEKDVELTVHEGMLSIRAERRVEENRQDKGYTRSELHYGTMTRTLPLPEGVDESSVTADYQDGVLEVRVPIPQPAPAAEPRKIAVSKK